MHHWLGCCVGIEVAGLPPEQNVGDKPSGSDDVRCHLRELTCKQNWVSISQAAEKDDKQCWKDPSDPSRIKLSIREVALVDIAEDDSGDQKAGDHKEYVDTYEAPMN